MRLELKTETSQDAIFQKRQEVQSTSGYSRIQAELDLQALERVSPWQRKVLTVNGRPLIKFPIR